MGMLGAIGAGILLSLAFFVHAPALWFVAAAALSLAFEDRRRCTAFATVALVLIGGGYLIFSGMFGPWFNFAAWDQPIAALAAGAAAWMPFTVGHVLGRLAICALAVVFSFAISTQPWHERRGQWMWFALAGLVASLAAGPNGPAAQSLQPSLVGALLAGAIAIDLVARHLADSFGGQSHDGESVIFVAVALQAFLFIALAPTPAWVAAVFTGMTTG